MQDGLERKRLKRENWENYLKQYIWSDESLGLGLYNNPKEGDKKYHMKQKLQTQWQTWIFREAEINNDCKLVSMVVSLVEAKKSRKGNQ